jgi:hypothetical protein
LELLDTTLLSNFAGIGRLDLLVTILPEAMTTPQVLAELSQGEAMGWLPESDWEWLGVVTLSANEQADFERIRAVLMALTFQEKLNLWADNPYSFCSSRVLSTQVQPLTPICVKREA